MFNDAPETVPHVDLGRYLGRWFEIARLPNRRQSEDCVDVAVDYSRADDGLRIVQRCIDVGGDRRTDEGILTATDGGAAKLSLSFVPPGLRWLPFTRKDYWILRLDPEYTMSLVGSRNRRRLWLLSRSRHPDPALRDEFLAHAERLGYDLTALIHTPQDRKFGAQPAPDRGQAGVGGERRTIHAGGRESPPSALARGNGSSAVAGPARPSMPMASMPPVATPVAATASVAATNASLPSSA